MDIDAVIAEGQATIEAEAKEADAVNEVVEEVEVEAETPEPVEEATDEVEEEAEAEESTEKKEDKPFPKKAVNALSKKEKTINKLKAKLDEQNKLIAEFEAKRKDPESQPKIEQLDADKYETYDDYIKALVEQQTTTLNHKDRFEQEEATLNQQKNAVHQEYIAAREDALAEQAQTMMAEIPDMTELLQSQGHAFDAMPDEVAQIFYEIDNAPAAAYVLAKEGKLERLGSLPVAVAAAEIVRAQDRFEQYKPKAKQTTNAPAPIQAAKAKGGSPTKKLEDMSTEELLKKFAG